MFSMLFLWDMLICPGDCVISILTIFVGSPISVVSHSVHMSFFISSIVSSESAKSRRSLTQTVMITILLTSEQM